MLRRTFSVIAIAFVLCALFVMIQSRVAAQGPDPSTIDAPQAALGTAFTYQGQLKKNGVAITNNCSMIFHLYDQASDGTLGVIGSPITTTVPITNGLFTVQLDFGASVFAGEARWLDIQVKCPGDAAYIDLGRQAITAAPYSMYSTSTGALQGRSVANINPATNQVLKWNGSTWLPADDAIGPPGSGDISAVYAGTGLSGGGTTGDVTLTVAFAGSGVANTVARSDHNHSGVYALTAHTHSGSDITSAVANATNAVDASNADTVDGQHASAFAASSHSHWGASWSGWFTGLTLSGGDTGLSASGSTYGVYGQSSSTAGYGVYGTGVYTGTAGIATGGDGYGIYGKAATGYGVYGDGFIGVYGLGDPSAGDGVYGAGRTGVHGAGTLYGLIGDGSMYGVDANATDPNGAGGYFGNWGGGTAVYATGYGSGSQHATLHVDNSNTTDGIASYMNNNSSSPTLEMDQHGSGRLIDLQTWGSGDFIAGFDGSVNLKFRIDANGTGHSSGGWSTSAQDYAEMLPAINGLVPGDVLVIGDDGQLTRSTQPFQASVVGVYSTQPGFVGGLPVEGPITGTIPLAIVGIVPVKVSAENGVIHPGDLLVASSIPGHAMKAGSNPPAGAVIGKALEKFDSGTGVIKMLVTLR